MVKNSICEELILYQFQNKIKKGMVTAHQLIQYDNLSKYKLSTIKSSLSKLKKKNILMIAFRINGKILRSVEGQMKFYKGKCYYKVK